MQMPVSARGARKLLSAGLLWVGGDAEQQVKAAFEAGATYDIERDEIALPCGGSAVAILAVSQHAEHGTHATGTTTVHDPVCHMDIDPTSAAATSEYKGVTYYFCARGCKLDFDDDPESVLAAEAAYDHSQPAMHGMSAAAAPQRPEVLVAVLEALTRLQ